jgi:hypothetical protein
LTSLASLSRSRFTAPIFGFCAFIKGGSPGQACIDELTVELGFSVTWI